MWLRSVRSMWSCRYPAGRFFQFCPHPTLPFSVCKKPFYSPFSLPSVSFSRTETSSRLYPISLSWLAISINSHSLSSCSLVLCVSLWCKHGACLHWGALEGGGSYWSAQLAYLCLHRNCNSTFFKWNYSVRPNQCCPSIRRTLLLAYVLVYSTPSSDAYWRHFAPFC